MENYRGNIVLDDPSPKGNNTETARRLEWLNWFHLCPVTSQPTQAMLTLYYLGRKVVVQFLILPSIWDVSRGWCIELAWSVNPNPNFLFDV
jgi:NADPH-dependent 7-cyano-7-deazaguanine reductase QueF